MPLPALPLDALLTGRARPFTRPGSRSGIVKSPRDGALRVTPVGLEGDEQGDLRVHGGVEKAIHHYPREHYAAWIAELGEHPLLMQAGAFGENFSTSGWSEADVCLGDHVRAGTALLEVSQGRMPCWKLNDRFEVAGMSLRVQETGRTGWYYRVLEEGVVAAGDILQLVERRHPDWSLLRLSEVLFDRRADAELLRQCLALPLTPSWRRTLERRLEKGQVEDWGPRLEGAPSQAETPRPT
ncbi:MOSC domain-containing protein [Pseudomonas aeruginosa]|nr:MOSC domain-containing protein [Pseudomonas aeruginosa]HBP5082740.1 MOSC domain-containing protein [Pseudomonas aeruginosa]